jgi:hypothetical protein
MADLPQFGIPEGLGRRLNTWANQLSRDKSYPWLGTGIIADLKCAAQQLGAPPFDEMFPLVIATTKPAPVPAPVEEEDEFAAFYAAKAASEYDL